MMSRSLPSCLTTVRFISQPYLPPVPRTTLTFQILQHTGGPQLLKIPASDGGIRPETGEEPIVSSDKVRRRLVVKNSRHGRIHRERFSLPTNQEDSHRGSFKKSLV